MASVYYERLLSEDQRQKGFEFREKVFRNSEAFKTGLITDISDTYDSVAEHIGFFYENNLIAYVRIIPWTEKLKLPYVTKYGFDSLKCDVSRLVEISRFSIATNLSFRQILGITRKINEIPSKVFKAHTAVISIAKNCFFYEKKLGYTEMQQRDRVHLLCRDF